MPHEDILVDILQVDNVRMVTCSPMEIHLTSGLRDVTEDLKREGRGGRERGRKKEGEEREGGREGREREGEEREGEREGRERVREGGREGGREGKGREGKGGRERREGKGGGNVLKAIFRNLHLEQC